MQCKSCGYEHTHIVYTRHKPNDRIERRRECMKCGERFTTWENIRDSTKSNNFVKVAGADDKK